MSKNKVGDSGSTHDKKNLNRRNFIKRSAAIGVGTAAFGTASTGLRKPKPLLGTTKRMSSSSGQEPRGLPAAIRARDLGASVIVVEQNFDIGGTMIHSNGNASPWAPVTQFSCAILAGRSDPEGLITIAPVEPPEYNAGRSRSSISRPDRLDCGEHRCQEPHTGTTTGKSCVPGPLTLPRLDSSSWTTTSNSREFPAHTMREACPAREERPRCSSWGLSPT